MSNRIASSYWRGRVVTLTSVKTGQDIYGHISGLSRNSSGEAILVVDTEEGETRELHPNNVKFPL